MSRLGAIVLLFLGLSCFGVNAVAQTAPAAPSGPGLQLSVNMGGEDSQQDVGAAIQVVLLMTLLTLGPSIVVLMTSFTRIIIVLGFVRTAMGVHQAPSNQIIVGLALVITFFIMQPILTEVNENALQPLMAKEITTAEAFEVGAAPLREFMLNQTKLSDVEFFLDLSSAGPTAASELPMRVVVPAFVMSEIRTAFQMGFLIFLPFIMIDFLVGTTLMAMGMMMMPPVVISLPFKLLLFVLVDGWTLVIKSLVQSFNI
ncbi:flagellar type III secretion system pore protein FliP [Pelagicoccus sp. SDUM812003]|uniref:flagellar type III secretion system pore protein FliP n=1 Tax=Pelagicoccus sp. SDUM812003 TaxID=3041267 RepID=UPI00280EB1F5|nr:flagellar type III secretion system pore protein FliP [Pelagicoccus sp. SDUM812003]MDQ8202543.1 flagellar type III secretion system pore protein FliP [Pelagicoccus sp. SDUM812003]